MVALGEALGEALADEARGTITPQVQYVALAVLHCPLSTGLLAQSVTLPATLPGLHMLSSTHDLNPSYLQSYHEAGSSLGAVVGYETLSSQSIQFEALASESVGASPGGGGTNPGASPGGGISTHRQGVDKYPPGRYFPVGHAEHGAP